MSHVNRNRDISGLLPQTTPDATPCGQCGRAVENGHNFCPACGSAVERNENAGTQENPKVELDNQALLPLQVECDSNPALLPQTPPITCSCGQQLPREARFCLACGTTVGNAEPRYQLVQRGTEDKCEIARTIKDELIVGKDPGCGFAVESDDYLSRKHARLSKSDGDLWLEDLGSSNGTFLRIRRPIMLEVGDEIVVGTSVFRIDKV